MHLNPTHKKIIFPEVRGQLQDPSSLIKRMVTLYFILWCP